jgi:hypothetical protein
MTEIIPIIVLVGGLGVAIAIKFVKYYKDFNKFDQVGTIWLISTAVCDVTISASLTWYLVSTNLVYNPFPFTDVACTCLLEKAQDGFLFDR